MLQSLEKAVKKDYKVVEARYLKPKNVLGNDTGLASLPPIKGPGAE